MPRDESSSQIGSEDGFPGFSDDRIGHQSVNIISNFEINGRNVIRLIHHYEAKPGLQLLADAIKDGQDDVIPDAHQPEERECFPETRRTTLKGMMNWIIHSPSCILWLSGPAGVGKSAIARTLCNDLQHMGITVGGSFFFWRSKPHKAKLLFPTLAYQFARVPCVGDKIAEKVAMDPLIVGKEMKIQLDELILAPLQSLSCRLPIVFVVNGLDKCEGEKSQCKIIDVIQDAINDNPHLPIRFVITSLPEKWIEDRFSPTTHIISLEETDETKEDIWKYLEHGFNRIYEKHDDMMHDVTRPWPSVDDMRCLVEKASGQFIYASTVLKHVDVDDDENSPVERLHNILSINVGGSRYSVFGVELDELYTEILKKVKNIDRTRDVLGGLLLVSSDAYRDEILSILEILFEIEPDSGYSALNHLHSVLDIQRLFEGPEINTKYAVHIHHKSFAEFLTSETRSKEFFIDTEVYHARLAIGCTRILMRLQVSASRPYYITWDYATMRLGYHCQNSGMPSPNLIAALQELDVAASLLPILLKTDGNTLGDAEPRIRKKCRRRSESSKGLITSDEAISEAMSFLSANELTCSFSIVHDGLLDLRDWLEHINCRSLSRLLRDSKVILKEIRDAQVYRPLRRIDLVPVREAFYASKDRSTGTNACLPPALRRIRDWISSDFSPPLFWLRGSAGSGKSTIAYTIAQEWAHSGASFFFSKARLPLRESRFIFQTISFQLRNNYPILGGPISRALEDPAILTANHETQLQKLILDPILQKQSHLPKHLVVVIDALDECNDNIIIDVIRLLAMTLNECNATIRNRLRFLVTSRPEQPLLELFMELHIPSFNVSAVNSDLRENDIRIFLEDELRKLAHSTTYERKERDIRLLIKISGGIFVAARIAVDSVAFGKSPHSQLQKLHTAGHTSGLDAVYRLVLDTIAQDTDTLQSIATIVLSFTPISRQTLTELVQIETKRLGYLLDALRAVIHVRNGDAIYPIHASLRDFLTNPNRCTDPRVLVDPVHHHSIISRNCLDRMITLLREPGLSSVTYQLDGKKSLPGVLAYACQYWTRHLSESNVDQPMVDRLNDFASTHLLYWVECLSLLYDLDLGVSGLDIVIKALTPSDQVPDDITELLTDAHWFLEHFEDLLSISPMYTYSAALPLTPASTRLHQQYGSKFEGMALHLTRKWD